MSISYRIFTHLATQQPARSTDSKSTHSSPTLTTWSQCSRLPFLGSHPNLFWDPLISTTKRHFGAILYQHHCLQHRLLESGKNKLWAWHFGSYIVVMSKLETRNILFKTRSYRVNKSFIIATCFSSLIKHFQKCSTWFGYSHALKY